MKTFNDLLAEANKSLVSSALADHKEIALAPVAIRQLKKFCQQFSAAYQANLEGVFDRIETELNKFGYTLGELDHDDQNPDPLDSDDPEDIVIFTHGTRELVKNGYFKLKWHSLADGQQFAMRSDGSALNIRVKLDFIETTPEEFDELLGDEYDVEDDSSDKEDETPAEDPEDFDQPK